MNKLNGSWKERENNFCSTHCRGKHYDPENQKRQTAVRNAIKHANLANTALPNACAGSMSNGCQCPYNM